MISLRGLLPQLLLAAAVLPGLPLAARQQDSGTARLGSQPKLPELHQSIVVRATPVEVTIDRRNGEAVRKTRFSGRTRPRKATGRATWAR